jgi:hypothetical protein
MPGATVALEVCKVKLSRPTRVQIVALLCILWPVAAYGIWWRGVVPLCGEHGWDWELRSGAIILLGPYLLGAVSLFGYLVVARKRFLYAALALVLALLVSGAAARLWGFAWRNDAYCECLHNMCGFAGAIGMYTMETGRFPDAGKWRTQVSAYLRDMHHPPRPRCPANAAAGECTYAMNVNLSGLRVDKVKAPERTVLLYETGKGGPNPSGDGTDMARNLHRFPRPGATASSSFVITADGCWHEMDTIENPRW